MWNLHRSKNKQTILLDEYREYEKLHIISIAAAFAIAVGVSATLFFLYTNIYQAISRTREAMLANSALNVDVIDFKKYDKVMAAWEEKKQIAAPAITRDPFAPTSTSTIPSTL